MKSVHLGMMFLFLGIAATANSQSVFKKLKNRAENSAGNAAGNQVDKGINKAVDKLFEKKTKQKKTATPEQTTDTILLEPAATTAAPDRIKAYSKYDFVQGKDLLLADDFSQDEIGEFPGKWNTNGRGEVVTLGEETMHWFKMAQESEYFTPNTTMLPESFTIEFDMIWDMQNKGWMFPELRFVLFNSGELPPTDNSLFTKMKSESAAQIIFQPGKFNNSGAVFSVYEKESEKFKTPFKNVQLVEDNYGKPMHFAISVHKGRFRFWINEEKVYDLPKGITASFNQFAISVSSSNYKDEDVRIYFSDFKLAGGLPETKSKLLTEGKLVSNAISFDVNSDKIKPSSTGAIKEIADVLKANEGVNIRIIGHTDSDGDAAGNKTLSLKRAMAVKQMLTDVYGIAASRMDEVDGRGEEEPVADNNTPVGKAKNRRVEFVVKK